MGSGQAESRLKEAATWLIGRHPDWGGQLADYLRSRLAARGLTPSERDEVVALLARFAVTPAVQDLLVASLREAHAAPESRRLALRAP